MENKTDEMRLLEKEAEITLKIQRNRSFAESFTRIVIGFLKYGSVCFISFMLYLSIHSLSGKITLANIGFNLLADLRGRDIILLFLGLTGIGYGLAQRNLRRRQLKKSAERIAKLEAMIDPRRTSSLLTPNGKTRKEDLP
jgi:hypothetical protein